MHTYGVAITIPEPHGSVLQDTRALVGDPMAAAIPPHVTLLPPTLVGPHDRELLENHLEQVAASHEGFRMLLSGTGTFRPVSPVVFVQVSEGISSCERLEFAIRSGPVERTLDFPYHPHVTIAHHLHDDALDQALESLSAFRADFVVASFELYQHGHDDVWRPLRSFTLAG